MYKKQLIIGLITSAILLGLGWLFISTSVAWLKSLDSAVAASLVTAALGLLGLWYAQWHSKSRDIAESHRESKIAVYSTFFDLVEKFQAGGVEASNLGESNLPDWLRSDFAKLNRGLILWASPKVIKAWLHFRAATMEGDGRNILITMDQMYRAIREDLGNSNSSLASGDLIRIGLKDPNELT
ncbi:MAG: hypothetical protein KKF58_06215 [Gammaproteobacteria bacterium]|nr:hypothetical protein [Gammaproteobacteria bacterium]